MTTRNRACKLATEPRPNDDETINMKRGVCCWSVTWNEGYLRGYFLNFFVADIHASKHGMSISKLRRVEYYSLFNYNYKYNLKKCLKNFTRFLNSKRSKITLKYRCTIEKSNTLFIY